MEAISNHEGALPFPFVSGLMNMGVGARFGKRVCFDGTETDKQILEAQFGQMKEKSQKKKHDTSRHQKEEKELLENLHELMKQEKVQKEEMYQRTKHDFMSENGRQREDKEFRRQTELETKKKEKFEFFPFTHGDEIEKNRHKQKNFLKTELRDKYEKEAESQRRTLTGFPGGEDASFYNKASVNGKVPVKFVTDYPLFLKPNKHYAYRRLNDSHVENCMQSAIERYEKQLIDLENERIRDAERLKN